jgi:hypothetical protein
LCTQHLEQLFQFRQFKKHFEACRRLLTSWPWLQHPGYLQWTGQHCPRPIDPIRSGQQASYDDHHAGSKLKQKTSHPLYTWVVSQVKARWHHHPLWPNPNIIISSRDSSFRISHTLISHRKELQNARNTSGRMVTIPGTQCSMQSISLEPMRRSLRLPYPAPSD